MRPLPLLALLVATTTCATAEWRAPTSPPPPEDPVYVTAPLAVPPIPVTSFPPPSRADETGLATWYGPAFAGRKTSNGERFDPRGFTAAHRSLPFGTWVDVFRPDNGRSVRVRITDRGPWGDARRVIDLSQAAADVLGLTRAGVARVELRIVRGG